jgi:hypothetical protein
MPIHDWTRVESRIYHDFHNGWLTHLKEALNGGVLPADHYALTDQRVNVTEPDVTTFRAGPGVSPVRPAGGAAVPAVAVVDRPTGRPVRRRQRRWTIRVLHEDGHRLVAIVELVSAANKDRRTRVRQFAEKIHGYLASDVHAVVIDLLPPTPSAPNGLHPEIWGYFGRPRYRPPADAPLMLAGYQADGSEPVAYLEPTAVGRPLASIPLFLSATRFVNVPLESTYMHAFGGMPEVWRQVLDAPAGGTA